jgi:hypothetical protein
MEEGESLAQHGEAVRDWGNPMWEAKSSLEDHLGRVLALAAESSQSVSDAVNMCAATFYKMIQKVGLVGSEKMPHQAFA